MELKGVVLVWCDAGCVAAWAFGDGEPENRLRFDGLCDSGSPILGLVLGGSHAATAGRTFCARSCAVVSVDIVVKCGRNCCADGVSKTCRRVRRQLFVQVAQANVPDERCSPDWGQ
jgi:hypothetical protein